MLIAAAFASELELSLSAPLSTTDTLRSVTLVTVKVVPYWKARQKRSTRSYLKKESNFYFRYYRYIQLSIELFIFEGGYHQKYWHSKVLSFADFHIWLWKLKNCENQIYIYLSKSSHFHTSVEIWFQWNQGHVSLLAQSDQDSSAREKVFWSPGPHPALLKLFTPVFILTF